MSRSKEYVYEFELPLPSGHRHVFYRTYYERDPGLWAFGAAIYEEAKRFDLLTTNPYELWWTVVPTFDNGRRFESDGQGGGK